MQYTFFCILYCFYNFHTSRRIARCFKNYWWLTTWTLSKLLKTNLWIQVFTGIKITTKYFYQQNLYSVCSFKFIPLNTERECASEDGIMIRTFTEDTTYLIIKLNGNNEKNSIKRSRLEGVMKRAQMKHKEFVDWRYL